MARTVGSTRGIKKRCDVAFSRLIRARGACDKCGATETLQTAHVISRRYIRTRYEPTNAFCLCASCHMFFTDMPVEFAEFTLGTIGRPEYMRLYALARSGMKMTWPEVERELKIMLENSAP